MRVLVALDDSEQAAGVANTLAPWLTGVGADVHLVSVVDMSEVQAAMRADPRDVEPVTTFGSSQPPVQPPPPQSVESHGQALARARTEREDGLRQLIQESFVGLDVQIHAISDDDTAGAIAALGVELDVDLVAVGTHGRSGLTRALMGSVAEQVVRRSERPVIVVRGGTRTSTRGATSA